MAFAIDKFYDVQFVSIPEHHTIITRLFRLGCCLTDKLAESLQSEKVIFRVILLVSEALSVLDDQDLAILDLFSKLLEADWVQNPVPGLPSHSH